MPEILKTKSIYYNDCVLISKKNGVVYSRKEVPNEKYRIICAPMTSLIGSSFAVEAAKSGISICIPRYLNILEKLFIFKEFEKYKVNNDQLCFISLSLKEDEKSLLLLKDQNVNSVLIDIAFSGVPQLKDAVENISKFINLKFLMVGNLMSGEELLRLNSELGSLCENLYLRVGIAGGSHCSTSDQSGFNRGQITENVECFNAKVGLINIKQVADGGIKNSGYCLKAFGAGADYVMLGKYFSSSLEAITNILGEHEYYGLASEKQIKSANLNKINIEGKLSKIDSQSLKPLNKLIEELWAGVCSGISYSGYGSVSSFIGNGIFEIKQNSLPPKNRLN